MYDTMDLVTQRALCLAAKTANAIDHDEVVDDLGVDVLVLDYFKAVLGGKSFDVHGFGLAFAVGSTAVGS